jgi:aryl-alcohol dehydrogenase-like predicted oxidoreductase
MTWGQQNTEQEAHQQLSAAWDEFGLNFMDAAEICEWVCEGGGGRFAQIWRA